MVEKEKQIITICKQLGYKCYMVEGWIGFNEKGKLIDRDKYKVEFNSKIGGIKGTSTVSFDTLDQVIDYLKKKTTVTKKKVK
jgi:hypothetical protein